MKKITIKHDKRGLSKIDLDLFAGCMLDVFAKWDVDVRFPKDGVVEVYYEGDLPLKKLKRTWD